MDRWFGKVAIVTGASAGIGAAIAEELVKAGVVVVGLARRLNKLEQLSSSFGDSEGKFHPRQCDLRNEKDLLEAFEWVNAELGGVDILVNNAGVSGNQKLIDGDIDGLRKILDVNVMATTIGIREAVASMKTRDVDGYIININSIAGHYLPLLPIPVSLYPASKFAVTALTETVRKELAAEANNKIRITSLSPGAVKTEIFEASGLSHDNEFLQSTPFLDAKDIADAVLYLLGTKQKVQITELTIRPINETF